MCSQCITHRHHYNHHFLNLKQTFNEVLEKCLDVVSILENTCIPTSQRKSLEIKDNEDIMKKKLKNARSSMTSSAIAIKRMVDNMLTEETKKMDELEALITDGFQDQHKIMEAYQADLEKARDEYKSHMESKEPRSLISFHNKGKLTQLENMPKLPIIQTFEFTPGLLESNKIQSLFGELKVVAGDELDDIEAELLSILPEDPEINTEENGSPTLTKINEIRLDKLGLSCCYHISLLSSNHLWISDDMGNIVKCDRLGNALLKLTTLKAVDGYHSISRKGELLYAEKDTNSIVKVTPQNGIKFINTEKWKPLSILCSKMNDDIIVGLQKDREAKLTKYDKFGVQLRDIEKSKQGSMFQWPHYLAENKNGDICVSDFGKEALVVVRTTGNIRCIYEGMPHQTAFLPYGVCTDNAGHIFVTNGDSFNTENSSIHILDQNGHLLSLLACAPEMKCPAGICVDENGKLYCGSHSSLPKSICMYQYKG